jgi:hypothetical protein
MKGSAMVERDLREDPCHGDGVERVVELVGHSWLEVGGLTAS